MCPNHLVSCEYSPKENSLLAGGCYNGQVCYWDDRSVWVTFPPSSHNHHTDRTGGKPVGEIPLSAAHREPVFKTMWISSKTGSEFFTASSDGKVLSSYDHGDIRSLIRFSGGTRGTSLSQWTSSSWTPTLRTRTTIAGPRGRASSNMSGQFPQNLWWALNRVRLGIVNVQLIVEPYLYLSEAFIV